MEKQIRSSEKISILPKSSSQPKIVTIAPNINPRQDTKEFLEMESRNSLLGELPISKSGYSSKKGVIHQCLMTGTVLLMAAACGMPIGYSAVLLPQLYVTNDSMKIDWEMGSWIASIHSAATPVGSFLSGPLMDQFGRLRVVQLAVFPLIAGWVLMASAPSYAYIIAGRIVAGLAVGTMAAPSQVLLGEISEPKLRGILIGAPFVSYSMGILFVYALGSGLEWRMVACGAMVLPAIALITMCLMPESPTHLVRKGYIDRARKALLWLRGDENISRRELRQLESRIQAELIGSTLTTNNKPSFFRTIKKPSVIKPLVIINVFNMLQILSGTYLVVFYAVDIIGEIGGSGIDNMLAAVLTAVVRLIFTLVCCFLLLVIPRRTLAIGSGLGSAISATTLGIYMYSRLGETKTTFDIVFSSICVLLYIASNTGFMVLPGILIGELLPAKIRGLVAGFIFSIFNLALFGIAKLFPLIHLTIGTYGMFMLFGVSSFAASIFLYFMLPETKGNSLSQIEDYFRQPNIFWVTSLMNNKKSMNTKQSLADQNVSYNPPQNGFKISSVAS